MNFKDNFGNITVSLFVGIENNISICYKFQNDFNDYFQDKNNKNINDYKSIFVSVKNNRDFNKEINEILSKIKNKENKDSKIRDYFHIFNSIDN